ncbi:MAG: hypothetical protein FWD61_06800 [Phycisphaerales bacterium]|nr:hypothetical protein [Phycisphaerales bacterium]
MNYDMELANLKTVLQQRISAGTTSRRQLQDILERIALLTLDALQNPWHPLRERLAELQKLTCSPAKQKKRPAVKNIPPYNQDRRFFSVDRVYR